MSLVFSVILLIVIMILGSFFSAFETSLTGFSKAKMLKMCNDGNKRAGVIIKLQEDIESVISTILICATTANSILASYSTVVFQDNCGEKYLGLFSMLQIVVIVFFVEVFPKMIAIPRSEKILIRFAYIIDFLYRKLRFINRFLSEASQLFARILGITLKSQRTVDDSLDELKGAIELHRRSDEHTMEQEKKMLRHVLDLDSVSVYDVMVYRQHVATICINDTMDSIVDQISNCPYTRVPIWRDSDDNIIGVLHKKDFLKLINNTNNISYDDLLSIMRKPLFISENQNLLNQIQVFKINRDNFAIVIDEYGRFMGILSFRDIVEEIVGGISDDNEPHDNNFIRKISESTVVVSGLVNLRDLNREIGTHFKCDMSATIAGFVINNIRMIPNEGQSFVIEGHRFKIIKRQKNQITVIQIDKIGNAFGLIEEKQSVLCDS